MMVGCRLARRSGSGRWPWAAPAGRSGSRGCATGVWPPATGRSWSRSWCASLVGEVPERLLDPGLGDLQAPGVRGLLEQGADGGVGIAGGQGQPPSVLVDGLDCGQVLEELSGQAVGGHADRAAAG